MSVGREGRLGEPRAAQPFDRGVGGLHRRHQRPAFVCPLAFVRNVASHQRCERRRSVRKNAARGRRGSPPTRHASSGDCNEPTRRSSAPGVLRGSARGAGDGRRRQAWRSGRTDRHGWRVGGADRPGAPICSPSNLCHRRSCQHCARDCGRSSMPRTCRTRSASRQLAARSSS